MSAVISDNALTILKARYLDGDSVDSMWDRVSGGNESFRKLLSELRFLPNSPTLFNAGKNNGCTLSACFVFDVEDTMLDGERSIVETRKKAIAVAKAGGGVGYYLGYLRPRGSSIKSIHRKACGPVTVLKDYHAISNLITQGGKRDLAQMAVLPASHDDVKEFIHCKDEDPQGLGSFNISVSWTDEEVKEAFDSPSSKYGKLWIEQVESAWAHGCPGMLFHDRINQYNLNRHLGVIYATNPCVTGETLILTKNGWFEIKSLVGKEVEVWNGEEWSKTTPRVTGTNRKILRVKTSDGLYLDCTPNHGFYLADGTKVQAKDLKEGDSLEKYKAGVPTEIKGVQIDEMVAYLTGFYCGDGFFSEEKKDQRINFYDKKISIGKLLQDHGLVKLQPYDEKHNRQRGVLCVTVPDKNNVPINETLSYRVNWLSGLLDSDGCLVYSSKTKTSFSYQISSVNKKFLRYILLMLRGLGVPGRISKSHEAKIKSMPGGDYKCKTCWVLGISPNSVNKLVEMGLNCRRLAMNDNNPNRESLHFVKVVSVEDAGRADKVYCFTEPKRGRGIFNGILTSQCGETPNRCDEPCNLGSLNLSKYVDRKNRKVLWDDLGRDVCIATRFLDDILDRNVFPHPAITKAALLTRKLGLGVMGWADMLALLHIHYDTMDAVELGSRIMCLTNESAKRISSDMAKEKEPYKGYDSTKSGTEPLRNETRTSIAPTGTISLIAGCSSSIEPHYELEWERTTKEGIKLKEKISVWDELDGFVPKTAMEIAPEWHIRHQAAFQKHTDLGVSKTINMPNSATKGQVSDAYKMMFNLGCKGGTVFRDGCRSEQVLVKKKTGSVFALGEIRKPNKPPKVRNSVTHEFHVGGTTCFLTVGTFDDGTPAEFFLRASKMGSTVGGMLDAWAINFSIAIQNGTPLEELIRHHKGTRFEPCGITDNKDLPVCTSIPDYVCRWLELRFISKSNVNGKSSTKSGQMCPECGTELVYQAGCLVCPDHSCRWTRCG